MKMQIVTCPRCGTYLFDDTTECHGCGHVLKQSTGVRLKSRMLPTDNAVQDDMQACPSCGETCRTGLVRCWNCSAFLRPDIEESYRKKRETGQYKVERVDLPILEASSVTEEDSLRRRISTPEAFLESRPYATEEFGGDDVDFELSSDAQMSDIDDESFDLSENFQLASESKEAAPADEADVFRLQAPMVDAPVEQPVEEPAVLEGIPLIAAAPEPPVRQDSVEPPVRSTTEEAPPVTVVAPPPAEGEDLLKIAADEEQDIQRVRKTMRSKDTFVIFCPNGCRIRVKERHRGKTGKCPRCQSEFVVPRKQVAKKPDGAAAAAAEPAPVITSKYVKWLSNIRLHTVDPLKLRIKADSLFNDCAAVDLGFSTDDLLMATLVAGKFGANPKKVQPLRQAMIEHFLKGGKLEALTVVAKKVYGKDLIAQINLAQPTPLGTESMFAGVPVFGVNRIAVKLPKLADDTHSKYLSFSLSEFRAFAEGLHSVFGIEGLGAQTDIPMTDEYTNHKCHLSQANILDLAKVAYYQKDPGFKLEVSGWKCAACGIFVSETARAAAKLGGANGKALPKTKCPKCALKFGNLPPLYQLQGAGAPAPQPQPAEETAATTA